MNKKILIVSEEEIVNDPRSTFLIYDLIDDNNEISILNYKSLKKNKKIRKNCKLLFYKKKKLKNNYFNNFLWMITKIDFSIYKDLGKFKDCYFDIIISINTKIAFTVEKYFSNRGARLILDIQDSLPDSYNSWYKYYPNLKSFIYKLFISFSSLKKYEEKILDKYDNILLTTIEGKNRIREYYGNRFLRKLLVLENYDYPKVAKIFVKKNSVNNYIIYFGSFSPHRGLETVLKTASLLKKFNFIKFFIIGGSFNQHYTNILIKKKISLKLKNVKILNWKPKSFLKKFSNKRAIGIVPHIKNPHTESTIPFKLFQYMDQSLPQIVSDCKPLSRHIKKSKSGLIFKNNSEEDLKQKILQLVKKKKFTKLIINGKKYIEKNNWKTKCTKAFLNLIK